MPPDMETVIVRILSRLLDASFPMNTNKDPKPVKCFFHPRRFPISAVFIRPEWLLGPSSGAGFFHPHCDGDGEGVSDESESQPYRRAHGWEDSRRLQIRSTLEQTQEFFARIPPVNRVGYHTWRVCNYLGGDGKPEPAPAD